MKKLTLFVALSACSLILFAANGTKPASHSPRVYIMMKHGKLVEVKNGKTKLIKKDVTLVNQTTIHPNGSIDASSGQSVKLKEGQYITMDGKIRNLKDMVHK